MSEPGALSHLERPNQDFARHFAGQMPSGAGILKKNSVTEIVRFPASCGMIRGGLSASAAKGFAAAGSGDQRDGKPGKDQESAIRLLPPEWIKRAGRGRRRDLSTGGRGLDPGRVRVRLGE
jgi:hypothetical protein